MPFSPIRGGDIDRVQDALSAHLRGLDRREMVSGALVTNALAMSANATLKDNQHAVVYRGTGGHQLFLPLARSHGATAVQWVDVMHLGAGPLSVHGSGGNTVDGYSHIVLWPGQRCLLVGDGSTAWAALRPFDPSTEYELFEDFVTLPSVVLEGGLMQVVSGAGAQVTSSTDDAGRPGIITLETGTTTTGAASVLTGGGGGTSNGILLGGGRWYFRADVRGVTLSDGTQRYTVRSGFGDVAGEPTDGVFFRYVDNVSSGAWVAVCRANAVETTASTGVAFGTEWQRLEIEVSPAANQARFWINGALVATITSNIPSGASRQTGVLPLSIVKSAGTTSRTVRLDFVHVRGQLTAPRRP